MGLAVEMMPGEELGEDWKVPFESMADSREATHWLSAAVFEEEPQMHLE